MSKYLIVILFLSVFSFAQDLVEPPTEAEEEVEVYDLAQVNVVNEQVNTDRILDTIEYYHTDKNVQRSFSTDLKNKYNTEEYDYSLTNPKESLLDKIKRILRRWLSRGFGGLTDFEWVVEVVLWIIGVLVVCGILYWIVILMGKDGNLFFSKKAKKINPEVQTIKENIHEINFIEIITKYELENNYRYAVRYQFLHLLKIFTDKHLIEWDPDKTNLDYINELAKRKEQTEFKKLTKIFDYVWYGEFDLDKENYERVKQSFNQLKQLPNE